MKLLLAFLMAVLVRWSRQVDWADLIDLSEEEANAALGSSFFFTPSGGTEVASASEPTLSGHSTPWNALWQHSLEYGSDRHHDLALTPSSVQPEAHQPSKAPHAGDEYYPIFESGAVQPAAVRSPAERYTHQPPEAFSTLDLPELAFTDPRNPPQALTLEQRQRILQEAVEALKSMATELEADEAPYKSAKVAAVLLDEFKTSSTSMREYKPGFLVRPRSSGSRFWPGGGAQPVLVEEATRQLIVYRYARLPPSPRPRTLFQIVGLLRINQDSDNSLRFFTSYRSKKAQLQAVGADCFVDHSALLESR